MQRTPWADLSKPLVAGGWVLAIRGHWMGETGLVVGHLRETGEVLVLFQKEGSELALFGREDLTPSSRAEAP